MLVEMADVLRSAGLRTAEVQGWKTRSHGPMGTLGAIIVHHTAGSAKGDVPSLSTVRDGRPGLAGPLAHLLLARSGVWYIVAAGKAWHAGAVLKPWQSNETSIGIECEGTGTASWPTGQMASLSRGVRALADHYGVPYARVLGHKEVCSPKGRKVDPNFSMDDLRASLVVSPSTALPVLSKGSTGPAVERLQRWLGVVGPGDPGYGTFGPKTLEAVLAYQKMRGIPADGVVGPATYREMGWL